MSGGVEVTVLMPCLNEAETVAECVRIALLGLERAGATGEVVVADNGSTDGSQALAERAGARVVPVADKGYGAALLGGIAAARGRYVVMADADLSYDFGEIAPIVERLRGGDHLVMGNRFKGGIAKDAMPALHRYLGNPVLSFLGRVFFRSPVRDFHCGMRGFDRDAILALDLRTTGMEFASEMVVKATLHGLRTSEVPVTLRPDGRTRAPHLRSWRDGWRHLRFLLLYSPRWLFLYPGVVLCVLGTALGLWLIPGGRTIGRFGLDVQTLLYAAFAVVIGFQSIVFGLFTKAFAISEGLLPADPRLARLLRRAPLEGGLLAGGLLTLAGIGGSVYGFYQWGTQEFGPLNASESLRIVIPSLTCLVLGIQTVLGSFFLSVLMLRRR
ncbi:MAG TPA: glycosyltransferase family 2 protein [Frankiaceae bacterium]|nr:glycosyltransferase family 2 protein [Frankiaceae bacterium]